MQCSIALTAPVTCPAAQAAGLDMGLNSATTMATVFVPINGAFDAAAAALNTTLDVLLAEKPLLTNVRPRGKNPYRALSRPLNESSTVV